MFVLIITNTNILLGLTCQNLLKKDNFQSKLKKINYKFIKLKIIILLLILYKLT